MAGNVSGVSEVRELKALSFPYRQKYVNEKAVEVPSFPAFRQPLVMRPLCPVTFSQFGQVVLV